VQNLATAIERTLAQLFDPAFLRVFILGILTTIGAIFVTFLIANEITAQYAVFEFEWQWVQDIFDWFTDLAFFNWLFGFVFFWLVGIFFPPISTIFMSIFLDDIVDAVEDKYYPHQKAGDRLGLGHITYLAVRLGFLIVVLNILVLPLYVILFWVPFAPFIIFYGLNSYLLGWGYYEMVAVRHLGIKGAGRHRRSISAQVLTAGLLTTVLFTVPILNLTAPILAVAMLSHIFHQSLPERDPLDQIEDGTKDASFS